LTQRRGFSLFLPTVVILAGAAYGAGSYLRQKEPNRVRVTPTRLAQATVADNGNFAVAAAPNQRGRGGDADTESARRTFETVYNHVKQYYVDRLPGDRAMSYSTLRSMLSSLNDPNCYFLEPEQYRLLLAESEGTYQGIGAALAVRPRKQDGYTDNKVMVVAPMPGSSAEKAGLKPGDVITHVDGRWILGYDPYLKANKLAERFRTMGTEEEENELRREVENARRREKGGISLFRAQMLLRGDRRILRELNLTPDKRVVTVQRPGVGSPLKLEIWTGRIAVPAISQRALSEDAGYIRIPVFTAETAAQVRKALNSFPAGAGIILDLRGNPGGLLDGAMEVEAALAPSTAPQTFGYEVQTGGKMTTLKATTPASGSRRPVVVLVDKGTASVAEALAASLADKGVATLVGGRTFGDATVQMAFALPDGSAFVLNTGRMQSPRRAEWANVGLPPAVPVAPNTEEQQIVNKAVAVLKTSPRVASTPRNSP
jgi:carboxyl-terminal processing protease